VSDVRGYLRARLSSHQRGAEEPHMYENHHTYLQSELDYRTDRIKAAFAGSRKRHGRLTRVRRSSGSSDIVR
jgi:hypothetical protein